MKMRKKQTTNECKQSLFKIAVAVSLAVVLVFAFQSIWIPYKLAGNADVVIRIYNSNGKLIRTLHIGNQSAGVYVDKGRAARWDGKDERGDEVASGLYFYTLQADKFTATKRMLILK